MKHPILTGLWLLLAAGLMAAPVASRSVTLAWNYPTNELNTNLSFVLHASTNVSVPLTNWPVLTNIVGTNLSCEISIEPGVRFFYLTASNFWGESDPSNVLELPPVPRDVNNLNIRRNW